MIQTWKIVEIDRKNKKGYDDDLWLDSETCINADHEALGLDFGQEEFDGDHVKKLLAGMKLLNVEEAIVFLGSPINYDDFDTLSVHDEMNPRFLAKLHERTNVRVTIVGYKCFPEPDTDVMFSDVMYSSSYFNHREPESDY